MLPVPREFNLFGVYLSPMLISMVLAVVLAIITVRALNKYRLSRFIAQPGLVFVAIVLIYASLIGTFVIPA
ncbi:uncharacterized protein DUF1656 [Aliiruegeria haliotis]|uniref:Uncharacterized protein DUF1656 n=1 Tax=Aliiruegeria haliotis TaxID=1280846 RepID=A0A2T0RGA6_9RHOB|nr:DUF1656 domain-containing protein [Aliiruegeria haliotis]PRY20236.1 uncharacterized protein DUF1656 [Aliiruegeria haliotis]